jgi:hypothetical protein
MARADGDPAIGDNGKSLSAQMQNNMAHFGKERGLKMYADWTDKIAAGELPPVPPRPEGIERNVVLTIRDWGQGRFIHDQASSDRRDPHVNANGPIYGMGTLTGTLEVLDPTTNTVSKIDIPAVDGAAQDKTAGVHADEIDDKGRVWMPSIYREGPEPAWCSDGSTPSSKLYPLSGPMYKQASILPVYDPATKKVTTIPMCTGGNHSGFTWDKKNPVFYMSGDTQVISWINLKVWDETHDAAKATGWCPMVLDTSGDGKITQDKSQWNPPTFTLAGDVGETGGGNSQEASAKATAGKPKDPTKDTLLSTYLYGMAVAPDGTAWLAGYVPYVPSGIVHLIPGKNPPETCVTEFYQPPKLPNGKYAAFGIRGVGVDQKSGIAWAAFSSGQIGRFDRNKCKVTKGSDATGQQCPEGWTFWDLPSPKLDHTDATSDFAYSEWPDYFDVMGLGKDAHFFPAINSDSVLAMKDSEQGKFLTFRVPYPMGFYTRGMDFRINSDKDGWKGKEMTATYSSSTLWHQEGGEGENSKLVTFQLRPDPLAD